MSYNFKDDLFATLRELEESTPQSLDEEWASHVTLAFKRGYEAGMTAFAWWKDGEQQVGTTGSTLKGELEKIKEML